MDSTYQNEERERERERERVVVLHHCWGRRECSSRCHRRDVLVATTNETNAHQVPERGGGRRMAAPHRRERDTPAREGGGGRGVPVLLDGGAGSAGHWRRGEKGGEREKEIGEK